MLSQPTSPENLFLAAAPQDFSAQAKDRPSGEITFSVCLAAYQVAACIGQAISSVLAQTHGAHEVIVCDDGSTDDIDLALAPYRDQIVLLRQENRGAAAARNTASQAATGEYVVFLDPDDRFLPERLEMLAELAVARPDLDVLTTDAFIELDGRVIGRYYTEANRFATGDQRRAILERNFLFGLLAVRREVLLAIGGHDESLSDVYDWDCWIRLIFAGARAGMVNQPLAVYTLREGSSTSVRLRLLRGRVDALTKAYDRGDLTLEERRIARQSLVAAAEAFAIGEAQEALVSGAPDARSRVLHVVFGRGFRLRSRVKALVAAAVPRIASAWLKKRLLRRSRDPQGVLSTRQ